MKILPRILFLTLLLTVHCSLLTEAKAVVKIKSSPIAHSVLPRNGVRVPFLEIYVTTDQDPVVIDTFVLKKTGLSTNDDVESVRVSSGYQQSFRGTVGNDDIARVRFFRGYYIAPNTTETFLVHANLDVGGINRTIGFELLDIETPEGSLYNQTIEPTRNRISYQNPTRYYYPTYRTRRSDTSSVSSYEVPRVQFEAIGTEGRIYIGRDNRIGRFRLKNPGRKSLTLSHIRFRNIGSANLADMFETLELKDVNGWTLATSAQIRNNFVDFYLGNYPIAGGDSKTFSIWGEALYGRANRTVQLVLDDQEDIGVYSGTYRTPTQTSGNPRVAGSVSIRAGNTYVRERDNRYVTSRNLWNRNYNPGEKQITFLDDTLSFKASTYIEDFRAVVSPSSTVFDHDQNGSQDLDDFERSFDNFRLYIDGQYIDQTNYFESEDGKRYVEFSVGEVFQGATNFRVVGDIGRSARSGDRLKLTIDRRFSFPEFEYRRY